MIGICQLTDWELLRKQKATLLAVIGKAMGDVEEDLTGIIHFLDAIQDRAVATGTVTQEEVFGEKDVYTEVHGLKAKDDCGIRYSE